MTDIQQPALTGEELLDILRGISDGVAILDGAGRPLFVNGAAASMLGFASAEEAMKGDRERWLAEHEVLDANGRPLGERSPYRLALSGTAAQQMLQLRGKEGHERWVATRATPMRGADGAVQRVIITFSEVTELRRAEEAAQRSEAAFRALIEGSPDAIAMHRQGRFVYVNPALVKLLRYHSAEQLIGRSIVEITHPDDREQAASRLRTLGQGAALNAPMQYRGITGDGGEVWGEVHSVPIEIDGQPAIVSVIRDLTERRRMEQRLLVADRLSAVGTLSAGMAHEINNPLAFVIANLAFALDVVHQLSGAVEPLDKAALGDKLRELHAALHEASIGVDRVRRTVRDLKSFSYANDEQCDLVDPRRVLDLALNMASVEIRRRARLVHEFGPAPWVVGNDARLCQVFLNLLLNAAQAIRAGEVEKNEVRVELGSDDGARVRVTIADTGEGMTPEVRTRIFDPFFTTKPVGEGTGLGLAICHGIVTAMGGEISVESAPGRGSKFTVLLPAASEKAKA